MPNASDRFPEGFVWGVATSAAQIEGAAFEAGKGESVWDRFASRPGTIAHGDTPAIACDHYHQFEADTGLMAELGIRHHRLSIAWPRIIPDGDGPINPRGLDFYDRLIDSHLAAGITPWITLFHWDLPQALEERGGWLSRTTADAFRRYTETVVTRLRDRVTHWFTLNEMPCFIGKGYGDGDFAPGRTESPRALNQAYHHALLAHGHGVAAIRALGGPNAQVGLAHNHLPPPSIPVVESAPHLAAAQVDYERTNGPLMGPLFRGSYPATFLEAAGADAPQIEAGDLDTIAQPIDFLGLNLYSGDFVRAGRDGQPERLAFPPQYPKGDLPWLNLTPQVLYWGVRHAAELFGVRTFYITEHGAAFHDEANDQGEILDLDRREVMRAALLELHRAIREGFDVRGYFAWSLLDNFEWAEGYAKRFGLVHVDRTNQRRTPKLSAHWYAEVIRENRVL